MKPGLQPFFGAVAMSLVSPAVAAPGDAYGRHMMWEGGWAMMFFGPLMMLLFIAAVAVVVVLAIRWLQHPGQGLRGDAGSGGRAALDILKERLARGEIDVAEYEERRRALGEG